MLSGYYMSPIKENTVRTQKLSYRHRNKNRSKGDAIRKMHTKCLCIQTNFTRNINSVGFKWGRLSQIWENIFCWHQTGSQDYYSLLWIKKVSFSTHYCRNTQALSSRTETSQVFCEWTCVRHTSMQKGFLETYKCQEDIWRPDPINVQRMVGHLLKSHPNHEVCFSTASLAHKLDPHWSVRKLAKNKI